MTRPLASFRTDAPASAKRKVTQAEWAPPTPEQLGRGRVIGVDPSVAMTGLCALVSDGELAVVDAADFAMKIPDDGPEGMLRGADELEERMYQHLQRFHPDDGWVFVHESPPTGTNPLMRTDSIWVGSQAVRAAARRQGLPIAPVVSIPHHKKITCGNRSAKKPQQRAVIREWAPLFPVGNWSAVTNEAKRDGFAIALTYLYDEGMRG